MILRKRREMRERSLVSLISKVENLPDEPYERPDNTVILSQLRQQHGDKVRVERKGVAGMSGGDVFIDDSWVGWFGGI
jgi:hypothetical protein